MIHDRATFEAYDGVEIVLVGGEVVKFPALTITESARFLRIWAKIIEGQHDLVGVFVHEFVERLGLGHVTLAELDVEVEGTECGALTVSDAQDLCGVLHEASWSEDDRARANAQVRWLDEAPGKLGTDTTDRETLFELGQSFVSVYYLHMYGLARDFCSRLHASPRVKTWVVIGKTETSISAAGTPP